MFARFARDNKLLLAIALVLFAGAISVTSYLTSQLYQAEAGWRHGNAASQLTSSKRMLESTFAWVLHDMGYLGQNRYLVAYAQSGFSPLRQADALKALNDFMGKHDFSTGLSLVDPAGRSRITLGAQVLAEEVHGQAPVARQGDNQPHQPEVFARRPEAREMASSGGYATTMLVFAAIQSGEGATLGRVVLAVDLARLLGMLSPGTFLEGWDGNWVFLGNDGVPRTSPPLQSLHAHTGDLAVSADETIHHLAVSLGGQELPLGLRHIDPQLAARLSQLTWMSAALLGVFLVLGVFIVYKNYVIFQESVEAQRALVFSLAKLAARRDEITGAHLERTRDYAVRWPPKTGQMDMRVFCS